MIGSSPWAPTPTWYTKLWFWSSFESRIKINLNRTFQIIKTYWKLNYLDLDPLEFWIEVGKPEKWKTVRIGSTPVVLTLFLVPTWEFWPLLKLQIEFTKIRIVQHLKKT